MIRPGATAVETALVLPALFLLVIGLIVGGFGIYRYQQVAFQAREAARWTSVRGAEYQKDTNLDSPTQQQIYQQVVLPLAAGMDPNSLSIQVQWVDKGSNTVTDWDKAAKDVWSINSAGQYVNNAVRVTISYQWTAEFFFDPITLQSVSEIPMSE
jgi:Flp pilus assembly protein TadG